MPYTHVQFIAYVSLTSVRSAPGGKEYPRPEDELRARHHIMASVIEGCRKGEFNHSKQIAGSETLKIFLGPEFYFRSSKSSAQDNSGNAEYLMEHVLAQAASFRIRFNKTLFNDWLFVPGTYLYRYPDASSTGSATPPIIFNAILPFWRTPETEYIQSWSCCFKQHFAEEDKLKSENNVRNSKGPLLKLSESVHRQVLTVGQFRLGLEICVDHSLGVLKKYLGVTEQGLVDIHLLTASGMNVVEDAIAARQGGYFFRCDGDDQSFGAEVLGIAALMKYPALDFRQLPPDLQSTTAEAPFDKVAISDQLPLNLLKNT